MKWSDLPWRLPKCAKLNYVLVGVIEIQKLPVLNQGQRDLPMTMSGDRDSVMGHLKKLVALCDGQSTRALMLIGGFRGIAIVVTSLFTVTIEKMGFRKYYEKLR